MKKLRFVFLLLILTLSLGMLTITLVAASSAADDDDPQPDSQGEPSKNKTGVKELQSTQVRGEEDAADTIQMASGYQDNSVYRYADSNDPDGPIYSWVELKGTTAKTVSLGDDEGDGPFPIGFNFPFYGNNEANFYVSSNGYVAFDNIELSEYENHCPLPSLNEPNNMIALKWTDLDPEEDGDLIYYDSFASCPYGGGQCLVVQYEDFAFYPGPKPPSAGTFEAILFESGDFLIQFKDAGDFEGSFSTTGLENIDGSDGLTYSSCNTAGQLSDNLAVLFTTDLGASTKSTSPTLLAGNDIDYTIVLSDAKGTAWPGASMTDKLPLGTTFVPGTLSCSSGSCAYDAGTGSVTWQGDVKANQSVTIDFDANVASSCGLISNQAIVSAPGLAGDAVLKASTHVVSSLYYEEDFETSNGGYTHGGTADEWEWGTPTTSPPDGAFSGNKVWGTDLDDEYEPDSSQVLTSTLIDLSGAPVGTGLILDWWQSWELESSEYDRAYVEVSMDGGPWKEVWAHTGSTTNVPWTRLSADVSAAAGKTLQVRWRLTSDSSEQYAGLYIDDVIVRAGCVNLDSSTKTGPSSVPNGQTIAYTIMLTNTGEVDAVGANLTDPIPAGTTFKSGSLTCSSGACNYDAGDKEIDWTGDIDRFHPEGWTKVESFSTHGVTNVMGLVYDEANDYVRYGTESDPAPTVYDVNFPVPHTLLNAYTMSTVNAGWPAGLNDRTGAGIDTGTGTYFMPQNDGDGTNADDNIIEVNASGTILNAWETDEAGNDSSDGSSIDYIWDIAVVPGTPNRYFVAAQDDGSVLYEIALVRSGIFMTNTWSTIMSTTIPGMFDNVSVDYDSDSGNLYHADYYHGLVHVTDLLGNVLETFTCSDAAGYNTGVTFIEGSSPREIWVTNDATNDTTRCQDLPATPPVVISFDVLPESALCTGSTIHNTAWVEHDNLGVSPTQVGPVSTVCDSKNVYLPFVIKK